jgi:uncharacterized protein (TIGR02271 family)
MALTDERVTTGEPVMAGAASERIVAMFESYERAKTARDAVYQAGVPDGAAQILDRNAAEDDSTVRYERNDQGFWGALKGLFVPEDEAPTYTEGLRRGHAMLVVDVPAGREDEVIRQLESFDPVDLEERERSWRAEGWGSAGAAGHGELGRSGTDRPAVEPEKATPSMAGTAATTGMGTDAELRRAELGENRETDVVARETGGNTIPVVEEELAVGKRRVDRGTVRVRSYVTERPVEETVNLREERVSVERRPASGAAPEDAFREREIEVSATGEEAVVSKDARVVEEVVVSKDATEHEETVRDNLRRTDVKVEDTRTGRAATPAVKPGR